jgi:predicted MFS family arabinose efflux permease
MRATVQSIYSTGIALGGGLAFFLGGWIGQTHGWRWAFYLLGFPGLALALLVFSMREPARGRTESAAALETSNDWRLLLRSSRLRYLILGYAFVGLASNNITVWVGTFFVRVHGLSLAFVGQAAGIIGIVVGIPAMILAGHYSDRIGRLFGGGRSLFTASAAAASVPLWIALLFTKDLGGLLAINIVLYALAILWVGPATADVHDLAGPHLRGLAIGIFFSAVNIFAFGIGSPLIGKLSDVTELRYSLLVCPVACAIGATLLWMGSRSEVRVGSAATATSP